MDTPSHDSLDQRAQVLVRDGPFLLDKAGSIGPKEYGLLLQVRSAVSEVPSLPRERQLSMPSGLGAQDMRITIAEKHCALSAIQCTRMEGSPN
jgi:hypothetical protein